jgi:hypothetical protein
MATDSPHADAPPDPVSRRQAPGLRERLSVAGRIGVAALGGYAVAALATALGALVLPLPRAEAVSAATQASFAVMAAAVVFTFAARSLARAALGIAGAAAILALGLWLAGGFASGGPA